MTIGAKKVIVMKRALDFPQDVGRDGVQVVVPKTVVCSEKA